MNSHEQEHVDQELDKLRSKLNEITVSKRVQEQLFASIEFIDNNAQAAERVHPATSFSFIKARSVVQWPLAASLLFLSTVLYLSISIVGPGPGQTSASLEHQSVKKINRYFYTPVTVHSLTKGPQIRYQRSRIVQTHSLVAKISYFPIQKQE